MYACTYAHIAHVHPCMYTCLRAKKKKRSAAQELLSTTTSAPRPETTAKEEAGAKRPRVSMLEGAAGGDERGDGGGGGEGQEGQESDPGWDTAPVVETTRMPAPCAPLPLHAGLASHSNG